MQGINDLERVALIDGRLTLELDAEFYVCLQAVDAWAHRVIMLQNNITILTLDHHMPVTVLHQIMTLEPQFL